MPIALHIVTPSGEAFRGEVERVVLPGSEGDFGVLPEHERFLTPLRIGEIEIGTGNETVYAAIGAGFADVTGTEVAVLVDSCELAHHIDVARAELAAERAAQGLAELDSNDARYRDFEEAVARARTRLAVARRSSAASGSPPAGP